MEEKKKQKWRRGEIDGRWSEGKRRKKENKTRRKRRDGRGRQKQ